MSVRSLLGRAAAAGVTLTLEGDRVRFTVRPPADLLAELRLYKAEIVDELRRQQAAVEGAGEIVACERDVDLLQRVQTGLGPEIDASLWRVLDRLLEQRDLATADALWRCVVAALGRGILSRLVGWVRSLDAAGADLSRVRVLVADGPGHHVYHDGGVRL